MYPYYIILVVVAACAGLYGSSRATRSERVVLLAVVTLVLVAFAGMRDLTVGTDTSEYAFFYEIGRQVEWSEVLTQPGTEPGYFAITEISRIVSRDYWALLTVIAVIVVFLHMVSIYRFAANLSLTLFSFVGLGYYTFFFNGARQGIACAIYSMSFGSLLAGRFWHYALWVLAASVFHRTAIIALPLYFFFRRRSTPLLILAVVTFVFAGVQSFEKLLDLGVTISSRYTIYRELEAQGGKWLTVFYVGLAALFIFARRHVRIPDRARYDVFLNMTITGAAIYLIVILSEGYVELTRMAIYFQLGSIYMWSYVVQMFHRDSRQMVIGWVVAGHVIFFYIFLSRIGNLVPYILNEKIVALIQ